MSVSADSRPIDRLAEIDRDAILAAAIRVARAKHFCRPDLRRRAAELETLVREAGLLHAEWDA